MTCELEKLSRCSECCGALEARGGPGHRYTYRAGCTYELPPEFLIPTCVQCGAEYFDEELERRASAWCRPIFVQRQREHLGFLLGEIRRQADVTDREIERACGVPPTFLSQVLSGQREANETLVGLIESFAVHPSEVSRRINRRGSHDTALVRATIAARSVNSTSQRNGACGSAHHGSPHSRVSAPERCELCDGEVRTQAVTVPLRVGRHRIEDSSVQAGVCTRCGEYALDAETLRRLELRAALAVLVDVPELSGPVLRSARKALGLKQVELATKLATAAETISRHETGAETTSLARFKPGLSGLLQAELLR